MILYPQKRKKTMKAKSMMVTLVWIREEEIAAQFGSVDAMLKEQNTDAPKIMELLRAKEMGYSVDEGNVDVGLSNSGPKRWDLSEEERMQYLLAAGASDKKQKGKK